MEAFLGGVETILSVIAGVLGILCFALVLIMLRGAKIARRRRTRGAWLREAVDESLEAGADIDLFD